MSNPQKRTYLNAYRGFESLPLRQQFARSFVNRGGFEYLVIAFSSSCQSDSVE